MMAQDEKCYVILWRRTAFYCGDARHFIVETHGRASLSSIVCFGVIRRKILRLYGKANNNH